MMTLLLMAALAQGPLSRDAGPSNLIIRWGASSPVVVKYETLERCEYAAVGVIVQGLVKVGQNGKPDIQPSPQLTGANKPYAFCIPG
jgi:hypothetical protein